MPVAPFGSTNDEEIVIVTAEFETADGMKTLNCSFTEEPEFSVAIYGDEPSRVIDVGETVRAVDICVRVTLPPFVTVTGIASVWPGVRDWIVVDTVSFD